MRLSSPRSGACCFLVDLGEAAVTTSILDFGSPSFVSLKRVTRNELKGTYSKKNALRAYPDKVTRKSV